VAALNRGWPLQSRLVRSRRTTAVRWSSAWWRCSCRGVASVPSCWLWRGDWLLLPSVRRGRRVVRVSPSPLYAPRVSDPVFSSRHSISPLKLAARGCGASRKGHDDALATPAPTPLNGSGGGDAASRLQLLPVALLAVSQALMGGTAAATEAANVGKLACSRAPVIFARTEYTTEASWLTAGAAVCCVLTTSVQRFAVTGPSA
jgi:hypothetical protein